MSSKRKRSSRVDGNHHSKTAPDIFQHTFILCSLLSAPETALLFSEHQREKVRKKTVSGRLFKINHISRRTWNFAVRVRIFLLASQETSFLVFLFYWLVWRFCLTSEKGRPTDTDCFILEALFSHYIQQTWLNYRRAVFLKGPAFPNTQHFLKQLE